jgi:hypothetical protein
MSTPQTLGFDPFFRPLKRLPSDVAGIERWIKAMGGRKPGPVEREQLKKHGLLGMPTE